MTKERRCWAVCWVVFAWLASPDRLLSMKKPAAARPAPPVTVPIRRLAAVPATAVALDFLLEISCIV